jgi:hypothetical protein
VSSRARNAFVVGLAMVLVAAWLARGEPETWAPPPEATTVAQAASPPSTATPPASAPGTLEAPPPPASTVAAPIGPVDPCGSAEDDPPITRPSLSDLLTLRTAELNDRMRALLAAPTASESLRRGWAMANDPARADEALHLLSHAPDRVDDGFDVSVALSMVLAARALSTDPSRAIRLAETAARAAPTDPLPLVIAALGHEHRNERTASRDLMLRAYALDPEEPAIAYSVAWRSEDAADPRTALAAYETYLDAVPGDRESQRRRARLRIRADEFAGAQVYVRGGVQLLASASFPREQAEHVIALVTESLARSASMLGVPRREELAIFVHADGPAMRRATCVQEWAGAVFDGALETDAVTAVGPGADRSLRHESFHAALHPAVPNVPTWLDEGLAQYASGDEGPAHFQSYALMLRDHTWIPFSSMNDAFLVIDDSADAGLAYHQALAMVEWLVERRGERGIRDAAAYLIGGGDPTRVLAEAAHQELDGETLLDFIRRHVASRAAPPPP